MNYKEEFKHIKKCFLMSQKAEAVPPLGTILGNIGVNTIKFCEEFNLFTKNLPIYFLVKVVIYIYENRTFKFKIDGVTTSFLINILKFERKIKILLNNRVQEKTISCINKNDFVKLALFKYPEMDLRKSIFIIKGTIRSMNIIIV